MLVTLRQTQATHGATWTLLILQVRYCIIQGVGRKGIKTNIHLHLGDMILVCHFGQTSYMQMYLLFIYTLSCCKYTFWSCLNMDLPVYCPYVFHAVCMYIHMLLLNNMNHMGLLMIHVIEDQVNEWIWNPFVCWGFFSLKVAHPTLFFFTYCKIKHVFLMENPPVIFTWLLVMIIPLY